MDVVCQAEGGSPGVPIEPPGDVQAKQADHAAVGVDDEIQDAEAGICQLEDEPCSQACPLRLDRHDERRGPKPYPLGVFSEPRAWIIDRAPDHQGPSFLLAGGELAQGRRAGDSSASQQNPEVTHAGTCRQDRPRERSKPHLKVSAAGLKSVLAEEEGAADQKDKRQLAKEGHPHPEPAGQ